MRRHAAASAAILAAIFTAAAHEEPAGAAEPVEVTARPVATFRVGSDETRFGPLEFLGGIDVTSRTHRFGGISGIDLSADGGEAVMVADTGFLIRARLVHDDGRLTGLEGVTVEPLLPGLEQDKSEADAEDIALDPADRRRGTLALERRDPALFSFSLGESGPSDIAPIQIAGADPEILRSNRGIESIAYFPPDAPRFAGQLIAIAEHPRDGDDANPGWILGSGEIAIARHGDYDISSARVLPGGDLLLLERILSPARGVAMRLRRIRTADIAPGARLDGTVLFEAGMTEQIDNMEGLAVSRGADGRIVLTLVSDNNNSVLERTLILQFALDEDG